MAYPEDIRVINVELWINGAWQNISPYVQQAGAGSISRGAGGEDNSMPPTTMSLRLSNPDGRFTQENPMGPYYPYLQQSTLIRYMIEDGGVDKSRFFGEVAEWPTTAGAVATDSVVQVEASNVFARWERGDTLESPMRRTISTIPSLVAYWPLEDAGEDAQTLVSGIPGKPPMAVKAAVDVAGYSGFLASKPVVAMGEGYIEGVVPAYVATGNQDLLWLTKGPVDLDDTTIVQVEATGSIRFASVLAHTNGDLRIRIYDSDGTIVSTSAYAGTHNINDKDCSVRLILAQSGGNVNWRIGVRDQLNLTGETITTGSFATQTLGRYWKVRFGHFNNLDCPVGHVFVANGGIGTALLDLSFSVLGAFAGETAGDRFLRNCVEQGVSARIIGDPADTPRMGPQPIGTLKTILEDCADVGEAIIFESRDELGVTMLTLEAMYNQGEDRVLSPAISVTASTGETTTLEVAAARGVFLWPGVEFKIYNSADFTEWDPQLLTVTAMEDNGDGYTVTYTPATFGPAGTSERVLVHRRALLALDYANHEIQPPAQPRRDSRLTANHVTLSRPGGSEYTAIELLGPRSILEPPSGIGLFKDPDTVNVYSDGQLAPQAEWRKAIGINNDARWSSMEIALHHGSMAARQAELLAFDIGHKITLDNSQSLHIYDQTRQLARGYTEVFDGNRLHSITANAVPENPFHILEFPAALVQENFEDTDYTISFTGTWIRTNTTAQSGLWSLSSPAIGHSTSANVDVTVPDDAISMSFWYRVSSEQDFDFFRVLVDGVQAFEASGDSGWTSVAAGAVDITGATTVTFRYIKDSSAVDGLDAAFIDNLAFQVEADVLDCRWSGNSTTLGEALTTTQTGAVAVSTGDTEWTTDGDEFPLDVMIGGERVTISDINGSPSGPALIATSAAVVGNNASVSPTLPTGTLSGHTVLIYATIRLAGTVNLPAGWTLLHSRSTMSLFAREYDGVWTMPTVTFSGGGAGNTTIAQAATFSNILPAVVPDASGDLYGFYDPTGGVSGVFEAGPVDGQMGLRIFTYWINDDWSPTTWDELTAIGSTASTTGDDSTQAWGYIVSSSYDLSTELPDPGAGPGTEVVGSMCVFIPAQAQEFVISARSVNQVVKTHDIGAPIDIAEPFNYGL